MSFNPFDIEYSELASEINDKRLKENEIRGEIVWFETYDIISLRSNLFKTSERISHFQKLISESEKSILIFNNELILLESRLKSRFNPFNFFSSEQKTLRRRKAKLLHDIEYKNAEYKNCFSKCTKLTNEQQQMDLIQEKYSNFNKMFMLEIERELFNEIKELENKFKEISNRKEKVDIQLKPIMDQINFYKKENELLEIQVREAEKYESYLNSANNSYERKMIHIECEDRLGDSRPQNIINNANRKIGRNKRDLEKLEVRALKIGLRTSRIIKKLVIDGNNMCYSGKIMLGINPLKCVISKLSKQYEIVLIFDASIHEILKINNENIESLFRGVQFHVVQPSKPADEIIIDIANNDSTCYIVSNDRFGDYKDKEVIYNERIINHEILDNKVIITDLDINIKYR